MSLEGHVPSKDEKIFEGVFYFIMSGRNWTVKEVEKRERKERGGYSNSVHSTWVASKTPSGESFPQAWRDGGQGSGVGRKERREKKKKKGGLCRAGGRL